MAKRTKTPDDVTPKTESEWEENPLHTQAEGALHAETETVFTRVNGAVDIGEGDETNTGGPKQQKDISETEIAERAHSLYRERGEEPGSDVEDWLRAERELRDKE